MKKNERKKQLVLAALEGYTVEPLHKWNTNGQWVTVDELNGEFDYVSNLANTVIDRLDINFPPKGGEVR